MSDPQSSATDGPVDAPEAGPLDRLLVVQGLDTHIDQLRHRRDALPERRELVETRRTLDEVSAQTAAATARREELRREQRALEDEVASLGDKRTHTEAAMYGGSVTNPRELQALQDELGALGRRVGQLEDRIIELMEATEPVDASLAELDGRRAAGEAAVVRLEAAIAAEETTIDAELDTEREGRSAAVAGISAELLAEYETLRAQYGGVAVARLVGTQCGGCHLTLSAVELSRIRKLPRDVVSHCDECGRLLVR